MTLTTLEKIQTHLLLYGITESVEIEKEAEDEILAALQMEDVENVNIDNGVLVIEYKD